MAAARRSPSLTLRKLLVANRGEIACRIIQTAKRLALPTVAVYCDAEANGKHVQMADEAYRLGPPPASTSYLRKDRLLEIARRAGAKAIHPGYGFLSENAEFAQLCADGGVEFVGPPPAAIAAMGSKSESKRIMIRAGVPVTPGYQGDNQEPGYLLERAEEIGFPVLIKAASGGGGRGMRLVRERGEFLPLLEAAKREARKYFADEEVILERFVERARHVEVQVLADKHGGCVYLFERDCSVQRRHQKVLEEAPAPLLPEDLRRRMGDVAVAAARAVGYVGAGTVEFLYDAPRGDFYFMEMNTRLQVEHPVTEAITGLDLVELQLRVACGEALPFRQEDLHIRGHAVEARIYAEDPAAGFLPGGGRLQVVRLPDADCEGEPPPSGHRWPVVRIDTGFREGDEVLPQYDAMIAKLIVAAETREAALHHLHAALARYQVVGVPTNVAFLRAVVGHPAFVSAADLSTAFLQDHEAELLHEPVVAPEDWLLAFFAVLHSAAGSPGDRRGLFRVNLPGTATVELRGPDGALATLRGTNLGQDRWVVRHLEAGWEAEATCTPPPAPGGRSLVVRTADGRHAGEAVVSPTEVHLLKKAGLVVVQRAVPPEGFGALDADHAAAAGTWLAAPMPGRVVKVLRATGETVAKGDPVAVLEAMKMEHVMRAPGAGVVEVVVREGDSVARGQHVAKVDPHDAPTS